MMDGMESKDERGHEANNGDNVILGGRVVNVNARFAFIEPDDEQYGPKVFAPISSFKNLGHHESLMTVVHVGDRVIFRLVTDQRRFGDGYCSYKALDITVCPPTTENLDTDELLFKSLHKRALHKRATGVVSDCTRGWGRITIKSPIIDVAFFAGSNILKVKGCRSEDLRDEFPIGTEVQFDMYPQFRQRSYSWYAINVRETIAQSASNDFGTESDLLPNFRSSAVSSDPFTDESILPADSRNSNDTFFMVDDTQNWDAVKQNSTMTTQSADRLMFSVTEPDMIDQYVQTDQLIESNMLETLFENEKILQLVCKEQPKVLKTWMFKICKNRF